MPCKLSRSLFRWIHVLAGVIWIGHLYFFNFVNAPFQGKLDGPTKKAVNPELLPRALWWFRWGAAWTWVTGVLLLLLVYYHGRYAARGGGLHRRELGHAGRDLPGPVRLRRPLQEPARQERARRLRRRLRPRRPGRLPLLGLRRLQLPRRAHPHRRHVRDDHGLERVVPHLARPAEDHPRGQGGQRPRRRPRQAGRTALPPQHLHVGAARSTRWSPSTRPSSPAATGASARTRGSIVFLAIIGLGWHVVFQLYKRSAKVEGF